MKLKIIEACIASYKNWLQDQEVYPELYKYENLKNFRANWNLDADDFAAMFDASFKSQISNKLWGGSVNSAKSVMLEFIKTNPEYVRSMFRDLYNESKDLSLRINRFSLHCDEMMDQLPSNKLKPVEHRHTPKIISVYLSFNDPELYTIIDYGAFHNFMNRLENQNIPMVFELERIFKLCRGVYNVMKKDDELLERLEQAIGEKYYSEHNMLMVHDLYTTYKSYSTY